MISRSTSPCFRPIATARAVWPPASSILETSESTSASHPSRLPGSSIPATRDRVRAIQPSAIAGRWKMPPYCRASQIPTMAASRSRPSRRSSANARVRASSAAGASSSHHKLRPNPSSASADSRSSQATWNISLAAGQSPLASARPPRRQRTAAVHAPIIPPGRPGHQPRAAARGQPSKEPRLTMPRLGTGLPVTAGRSREVTAHPGALKPGKSAGWPRSALWALG